MYEDDANPDWFLIGAIAVCAGVFIAPLVLPLFWA